MKRPFLLFSALALCLGAVLGACTPPESSSSAPAAQQDPAQPEAAPAALQMLTPGNSQGRYAVGAAPDGTDGAAHSLLCWIDYNAAAETVLCAQPNCPHNSDACPAWVESGPGVTQVWAWQNLVLVYSNGDNPRFFAANGDGSNRHALASADAAALDTSCLIADSEFLYYTAMDNAGGWNLCRLPLDGGTAETLLALSPETHLLGCDNRSLVLFQTDTSAVDSAWQNGSYNDYSSAFDALGYQCRVWLWDVDAGSETELASWTESGGDGFACLWQDGKLYRVDNACTQLLCTDAAGSSQALPLQVPGGGSVSLSNLSAGIDGRLFADVLDGSDAIRRYALDPADGTATPLTLSVIINGREIPLPVLGEGDGQLLVCYLIQDDGDTVFTRPDGTMDTAQTFSNRCALIPVSDYFSSTPNYRDVPTQYALLDY